MTLYRKYRSQKLSELVGQPQISEMLGQAISTNRIAHAYLFAGPRGTGKTSVARIVAKAINCLNSDKGVELPCNECANCLAINQGAFLDVVEIDAASNRRVEEARDLIEQVHAVPSIGKYKVFILDEVHMLTSEAFNTLLKTLEEPPAHVVFILCTTESHKVPVTIASRCQRFVFSRANNAQLHQLLSSIAAKENVEIDDDAIALLSQLADGGYRDGVMLLDQTITTFKQNKGKTSKITREGIEQQLGLASRTITQSIIGHVINRQTVEAVAQVEKFIREGGEVRYLLNDLINQLRLLLLHMLNTETADQQIDAGQKEWFTQQQSATSIQFVSAVLKKLVTAQQEKSSAAHPALSLEMAIIEATSTPQVSTQPPASVESRASTPTAPIPAFTKKIDQPAPQPQEKVLESQPSDKPAPAPEPITPPADAEEAWKRVLGGVLEQNKSIGALLRHHCTPIAYDGKILTLQFWNAFHKKQVEVDKNRLLVEQVAATVFGQPIKIKGELADKSLRPKKKQMSEEDIHNVAPVETDEDLAGVAAEIFGGEFLDEQ